ncbi:MAG: hypothetical protein ACRDJI_01045, partial [Actinomycetota bacterium]
AITALIFGTTLAGFAAVPAAAESAEPPVAANSWYWEDKQSQEFTTPNGEKVVIETPSPFCPEAPGALGAPSQTCADGRLPVEIQQGDYETPNKLSAVLFDLFTVPTGSTVSEFTVTFLEAKGGCFDDTGDGNPDHCEETDPINIDGKKLQACILTELFGDGDGRQYKEMPKFVCSTTDPVAARKEVKPKGDDPEAQPEHVWTFDLTPFAQQWLDKFTPVTGILITAAPPKEQAGGTDNWRVVLAGPKFKNGITSKLVYEPPEETADDTTTTTDDTTTTTTDTGDFGGTTDFGSTGDFGDTGGGDFGDTGGGAPPVDAGGDEEAAGETQEIPKAVTLPWYVVAAVIAGLIAFSLVRSAVVEAATGIRPNGVLAQIRRINADRKGVALEAAGESTGAFAGIAASLKSLGSKVSDVTGKLFRKGQA